jgi:hypothetical protein
MPEFKYQNIRLDDGTFTRPADEEHMGENPRFLSAMRMLDTVFRPDKTGLRIADLGCLEGGYAVEFARKGSRRSASRFATSTSPPATTSSPRPTCPTCSSCRRMLGTSASTALLMRSTAPDCCTTWRTRSDFCNCCRRSRRGCSSSTLTSQSRQTKWVGLTGLG